MTSTLAMLARSRAYVERDVAMTDDLLPTIGLGLGAALLAFELFAALVSLLEAHGSTPIRREWGPAQLATMPTPWFSPRAVIRTHFARQRDPVNDIRRQYPMLRSSQHGRELRGAIRRHSRHAMTSRPRPIAQPADARG